MDTATLMSNKKEHFDVAIANDVSIEKGKSMFSASNINGKKQKYKQPDEDFYRALSAEEFREKLIVVLDNLDKKYANRCK